MVSTHALTPHTNSFKKSKFETETKLKKIKETKGCSFYKVAEISGDVYLVIALPKSILILKYAHAPYNKFLKLKELGLDAHHETITSLDLMPHPNNATSLRLGIGMQEGFKVLDLQSLAVEDFGTPVDAGDVRGSEVFEEGVVFCFEHMGLLQPLSTSASIHAWTEKTLNWRHPLTFHGRLTPTHLISGSATTLDVISLPSGKIMHVFETKRDKIKGLHLLVCKEGRVFVMAEEERDGGAVGSVILIEVVD
ncbi:hypothetical protein BC832DRAFT_530362 [Gaertneriomyces semiglobifer]|nr:hypothetical protein BC832DRAFT_530362 [Gaertneriomyces semiglobifer]